MPLDLIVRHVCPADGTQKGLSKCLLQLEKRKLTQMQTNIVLENKFPGDNNGKNMNINQVPTI
jgi:hypothetical protein